ncbi:MAG TPA: IS110 family transposase [Polyangiaceae bacterium]|nr:IS110 family transposase [Polyangiaceae bacterium]
MSSFWGIVGDSDNYRTSIRWDESSGEAENVMPPVTKSKAKQKRQVAAPVTALASREPLEVPTAKRRARRRSDAGGDSALSQESKQEPEISVILPPPGRIPGDAPARSETQIDNGGQGRMTMRIVALDLGTKKVCFCEVSKGEVIERATVSEVTSLKSLLGPEQAPARVAIEACRQAWFVHDLLVEWGNEVLVVDTTRSRQLGIGQHGRKTDRIDAEVLARALESGRIPLAHVLSPKRRELRRALSVRRTLVEARAQLVTTVRGLVREQGERVATCQTSNFVTRVRSQKLPEETMRVIEPLLVILEATDAQLSNVEEQLTKLCEQEPVISTLTTVPGVGTVVAAGFVAVIDDAKRFRRAHQVESYIGLVPSEKSSGGKQRIGAISKSGNRYLRALLVQAAWTILRSRDAGNPLYLWVKQLVERRGKQIAVVALARRLVGVLWAMWRDGTVYDTEYLAKRNSRGLQCAIQTIEQQQAALTQASKKSSVLKSGTNTTATTRRTRKTSAAKAA